MRRWLDEPEWDISIWEEVKAARLLGSIGRLHITGGEPIEDKHVLSISDTIRKHFKADKYTIETARYHIALTMYDEVYFSHYGDDESWDALAKIRERIPSDKVTVGHVAHAPDVPGGGGVCHRGLSGTVALYAGQLYPCVVGPGIEGAESIPLTSTWREEIQDVPMPCDRCRFSVTRGK